MTERPLSWLTIGKGLRVVGRDGEELGQVSEVVGDETRDIFDGLTVKDGLLGPARYVPAEKVGTITSEQVEVDLTAAELEALDADGPQGL